MLAEKTKRTQALAPQVRASEKQRSRDADARALATGVKTREDLRRENSPFRALAHEPIQWDKTHLI
jgi:hypothetical protein